MDLHIGTPFKISLTPYGPTIIYSDSYEIGAVRNVVSGNVTVTISGPGMADREIEEELVLNQYSRLSKRLRISGLRYLAREIDGTMFADWGDDSPPTIGQSMKVAAKGGVFSIVWAATDVDFDEGVEMGVAIATIAKEFDPAAAAAMIEAAVEDCDVILMSLFSMID